MGQNSIFISGYAKLPHGITASALYTVIAVAMIIDQETGVIEDVDCSLATSIAVDFIRQLIVGKNIMDYEQIAELFNQRYYGTARKAILSAIKSVNEKYKIMSSQQESEA